MSILCLMYCLYIFFIHIHILNLVLTLGFLSFHLFELIGISRDGNQGEKVEREQDKETNRQTDGNRSWIRGSSDAWPGEMRLSTDYYTRCYTSISTACPALWRHMHSLNLSWRQTARPTHNIYSRQTNVNMRPVSDTEHNTHINRVGCREEGGRDGGSFFFCAVSTICPLYTIQGR